MTAPAEPKAVHAIANLSYSAPFIACRFDPTGRYLFATAEDRTIQRWNLANNERTAFTGHESWAFGVGFVDGGATLL